MDNHATVANSPTFLIGNKVDAADIIPDFCFNLIPRLPAILTHGDSTAFPHSNGTIGVSKLDILKVIRSSTTFHFPRLTSIFRMHDGTVPTDSPSLFWMGKLNGGQVVLCDIVQQPPVLPSVLSKSDKTNISHSYSKVPIYKMDTIDRIFDMTVDIWNTAILIRPLCTTVLGLIN